MTIPNDEGALLHRPSYVAYKFGAPRHRMSVAGIVGQCGRLCVPDGTKPSEHNLCAHLAGADHDPHGLDQHRAASSLTQPPAIGCILRHHDFRRFWLTGPKGAQLWDTKPVGMCREVDLSDTGGLPWIHSRPML